MCDIKSRSFDFYSLMILFSFLGGTIVILKLIMLSSRCEIYAFYFLLKKKKKIKIQNEMREAEVETEAETDEKNEIKREIGWENT